MILSQPRLIFTPHFELFEFWVNDIKTKYNIMSTLRIFCMTILQNYNYYELTWSQGFIGYLRHGVPQIIVSSIPILPVVKVTLVKENQTD